MVRIELYDLLSKTQEYIAKYYAAVLTDAHKRDQLKSYIEKFIVSIVALNQNVKIMSDQIIDYATQNGTTDIGDYVKTLRENSGIDFACSFAGTDYLSGQKVQLGDVIRCKLTYRVSIFGFGDAVFPVTVQADSQGISQVYWK